MGTIQKISNSKRLSFIKLIKRHSIDEVLQHFNERLMYYMPAKDINTELSLKAEDEIFNAFFNLFIEKEILRFVNKDHNYINPRTKEKNSYFKFLYLKNDKKILYKSAILDNQIVLTFNLAALNSFNKLDDNLNQNQKELIEKIISKFINEGINFDLNGYKYSSIFEENIELPDKISESNYDIWHRKLGKEEADKRLNIFAKKQQDKKGNVKGKNWFYNSLVEKYGIEEAIVRYKEKYGIEAGDRKYNEWIKANIIKEHKSTKVLLIEKYGEQEGNKKFEEICKKISNSHKGKKGKSLYNNWLEKYGIEEADKRMIEYKKSQSEKQKGLQAGDKNPMSGRSIHDVWVEKYGIEEADRKLIQYKENKKGKPSWNAGKKTGPSPNKGKKTGKPAWNRGMKKK